MLEALAGLDPRLQALLATIFTWGMTAAGAGPVFFVKRINQKLMDGALGMAAGGVIDKRGTATHCSPKTGNNGTWELGSLCLSVDGGWFSSLEDKQWKE